MKKNSLLRLNKHDKKRLAFARKFLLANLSNQYTIREIATEAGINRYKLTYGFKQLYGYSIHQFVVKKRMEKAKKLLQQTDHPFKEIAGVCGYRRVENFNHAFKKYYGHTPSELRK